MREYNKIQRTTKCKVVGGQKLKKCSKVDGPGTLAAH